MNIVVPTNAHLQLKAEGIFTRELLDCFPDGFSHDFTADDLLKLMEDIFIIAPLPEKGKFFLPYVLPTTSNLENIRSSYPKVTDALVLTWDIKPVPQGIFPALVVNLVKQQKSPKFGLCRPLTSDVRLEELQQYRNAILLLCLGLGGGVLLVDSLCSVDVYCSGPSENCLVIRNTLLKGIRDVVKKFQYKPILLLPQERFYCSMCASAKHLCCPEEGKKILTCCRDPRMTAQIDRSRQLPWIASDLSVDEVKLQVDPTWILKKKSKLVELISHLTDIEYEWDKISTTLEVEDCVLGGLNRSHDDNTGKCITVLQSWMDKFPSSSTWDVVLAAVKAQL